MHPNEHGASRGASDGSFGSSKKLRTPQAAEYVGLSGSTLAKLRIFGGGPRYFKAGKRVVVYDIADLNDWLAARRRTSTSEEAA